MYCRGVRQRQKRQIRCGASTCACNHPELLGKDAPNASTKNNFAAWLQARSAQLPQIMPHTARCTRSPQGEFERMVRVALNPPDSLALTPVPPALPPSPPARRAFLRPGLRRQSGSSITLGQLSPRSAARSGMRAVASCPDLGSAVTEQDSRPGGPLPSSAALPPLLPLRPPGSPPPRRGERGAYRRQCA